MKEFVEILRSDSGHVSCSSLYNLVYFEGILKLFEENFHQGIILHTIDLA